MFQICFIFVPEFVQDLFKTHKVMIKIGRFRAYCRSVSKPCLVFRDPAIKSHFTVLLLSLYLPWLEACRLLGRFLCSSFIGGSFLIAYRAYDTSRYPPPDCRKYVCRYPWIKAGEERTTLTFYSLLANYLNSYHLSRYSTGLPYMCTHIFQLGNWQHIYEFTNTHNLFLSLIFYNDSCG